MKTLADLKRRIQPGVRLRAIEHWQPNLMGSVRTVTEVQGNGYFYRMDGDSRRLWSGYGAAVDFSFPTSDSYHYQKDGRVCWTLEFLHPQECTCAGAAEHHVNCPAREATA